MLSNSKRLVMVRSVLSAAPIHTTLTIYMPKWVHESITKKQRSFFWDGSHEASGGNCDVSWHNVCHLIDLGGLGFKDLRKTGWAFSFTGHGCNAHIPPSHGPWAKFPVKVGHLSASLVHAASMVTSCWQTVSELCKRASPQAWYITDQCLSGWPMYCGALAPTMLAAVGSRTGRLPSAALSVKPCPVGAGSGTSPAPSMFKASMNFYTFQTL